MPKNVTEETAKDGERLVNTHGTFLMGKFLDPHVRPRIAWNDAIAARAMYRNGAFAFWTTTSPVPAVERIQKAEPDDVEYVLIGDQYELRFCFLWYEKAQRELKSFLDRAGLENLDRELLAVTESVLPFKAPPEFGEAEREGKVMKVKTAFWAEHFQGVDGLRTVGVLALSEDTIVFVPAPGQEGIGAAIDERLASALDRGLTPDEILGYFVERSNGISWSVSKPETIEAQSVNDAALKQLRKVEKKYLDVGKQARSSAEF